MRTYSPFTHVARFQMGRSLARGLGTHVLENMCNLFLDEKSFAESIEKGIFSLKVIELNSILRVFLHNMLSHFLLKN